MRILQYGVRPLMLLKYFGQLCIALALLTLVPLLFSLAVGEWRISLRYGIVVLAVLALGTACSRLRAPRSMQHNEAVVVTVLIFLFSPLVLTWPVMASGLSFFDALFETVSAVTTTGLSTVTEIGQSGLTFLFARAWMQWIGGLGIVVLCMAALIQPGMTAKRLDIGEDFGSDIIGGTRAAARRIITIYLLITCTGVLLLMLTGAGWFVSLVYVLAAVSTGGFSPHAASLAGLASPSGELVVTVVCLAGAVTLPLYYLIFLRRWRDIASDRQLQGFLAAAVVVSLLLAWLIWVQEGGGWLSALQKGTVNGLSALTTAGFSSISINEQSAGVQLLLILVMSIGGCAGSTAGGIKIIRLLILLRIIFLLIQRTAAPRHAVIEPRFDGRRLADQEIYNAIGLFALFGLVSALSWLSFLLLDQPPLASLFEVVSALATAGLSTGLTSTELHPLLKAVLCLNMLFGRLEIIAWLIFLHPGTWTGLKKEE